MIFHNTWNARFFRKAWMILFSVFVACPFYAQPPEMVDTVYLFSKKKISEIEALKDTSSRGKKLLNKIFYDYIYTPKRKTTGKEENGTAQIKKFTGKTIDSIKFVTLPPFGVDINKYWIRDSLDLMREVGNKLYFPTNKRVLKSHLIINEGQTIDPVEITENERLLRKLSFIEDARIYLQSSESTPEKVNVIIVTQDIFPYGVAVNVPKFNKGSFELWNDNIFGLGHQNMNALYWEDYSGTRLGYMGSYRINNVGGSFVNAEVAYKSVIDEESYLVKFNRPFFSLNTKYAGGTKFESSKRFQPLELNDSIYENQKTDYNLYELWFGRAFQIPSKNLLKPYRRNLVLTGKILNQQFLYQPDIVQPNTFSEFHSKMVYFGSIGYSVQAFRKNRMIYGFGQTEDIPYGYLINYTAAFENNEYHNRLYQSIHFSTGRFFRNLSYLYGKVQLGGFLHDKNLEQAQLSFNALYFTELFTVGRSRYRFFLNSDYTIGHNRLANEKLDIYGSNGIDGLSGPELNGKERLNVGNESIMFTPFYFFGFRMAAFQTFEISFLNPGNESIFDQKPYTALGIGVRLRNENLVFKTIQIKFTFFPSHPENANPRYFDVSQQRRLKPKDFFMGNPSINRFD